MSELAPVSEGCFALIGTVNKDTVPELVNNGWAALASQSVNTLVVDLSEVKQADSSALAMLLSWGRRSRQGGKELTFEQIPEELMALARVCGMDELLPLAE